MWGFFRRTPRLPAGRRPPLGPDERVLAWTTVAGTGADGVLVVTNHGVWLPGRPDRLGWHQVHKATWSDDVLTITPAEVVAEHDGYAVVADQPARALTLADPGDVPHHVRARVTRSVGYSLHHRLDGGGLRVVGRRVAGVDGLRWTVRYDAGVDTEAGGLREFTAEVVAAARASADQDQ
ncbi:hypothetical protein ACN27F_27825 [Solwaraspora sp. WMMB335]|uniref:hypothetical protein n=1 Tax=Solwaraspora sp. WMMB335 TaxID=3404118 RepID=UPI003B93D80B